MSWIRYIHRTGWHYLLIRLPFHKSLEVGIQDLDQYDPPQRGHFDMMLRLNLRGHDHAGIRFFVQFWRLFFEFNLCDSRHWNYFEDRWVRSIDEETHVGCDANQDSSFLHGGEPGPDGLGSTLDDNDTNRY